MEASFPDGSSIVRVQTAAPIVILSYDDGPEVGQTDGILSVLNDNKGHATFFVLADRALRARHILEDVINTGHEVGLHGLSHTRLTLLRPDAAAEQILRGRQILEDLTGKPVRWFRPPFGAQTVETWRATVAARMTPVGWNLEFGDWMDQPIDELCSPVRAASKGDILLLHDSYGGAGEEPHFDRRDLSREIIRLLAELGLGFTSLSEALATQGASATRRVWLDRRKTRP